MKDHYTLLGEAGEANQFFQEIFEVAQLAIWEYDLESGKTTWSGDLDHFFDSSLIDSLSIQKAYSLLVENDRSAAKNALEKAIRWRVKWDLDAKLSLNEAEEDHEFIWIRHVGYPVLEGTKVVKLRGMLMDIDERKRSAKEREKKHHEVLKYQSMLLNTQINPHFIFNALNSVQYYILENDTGAAIDFIADFSSLIRGVLENSMHQRISISEEVNWLEKYLQTEQKRHLNKFSYSILIDDEIDQQDVEIPTMVVQPFVENAIMHGFSSKDGEGRIDIKFYLVRDTLYCTIEDNGIGRKKAAAMKETLNIDHKSFGMHITQKKLEVLSEIEQGHFGYEVIDKEDEDGNALGTKVVLSFDV